MVGQKSDRNWQRLQLHRHEAVAWIGPALRLVDDDNGTNRFLGNVRMYGSNLKKTCFNLLTDFLAVLQGQTNDFLAFHERAA